MDILAAGGNISRHLQIMLWLFHLFSTTRMVQYLIKYVSIMKRVRFLLYIDTSTRSVNIKLQSINEDSIMCQWAGSSGYKASSGDTTPVPGRRGRRVLSFQYFFPELVKNVEQIYF